MTALTGYRNSQDQIDTRAVRSAIAANQIQMQQPQLMQGKLVAATGLPAPGGTISLQKKPVHKIGGAEPKIASKRQARTTHHSRQISWSRDQ